MSITIRIEKFIEAIISRLGAIEDALGEHNRTANADQVRQESRWCSIGRQIAEVRPDDEYRRGGHTYKHKSYWQQVTLNILTGFLAIFTLCAFLAAAFYAYLANCQLKKMDDTYREVQKQTCAAQATAIAAQAQATLMRQQLEGTQAAVVSAFFIYQNNILWLHIVNRGKSIAPYADVKGEIARIAIPSGLMIGKPYPVHQRAEQVLITDIPGAPPEEPKLIPIELGASDAKKLKVLSEAIVFRYTFSFDDGFGGKRSNSFCKELIASAAEDGKGNLTFSVPGQPEDCVEADGAIKAYEDWKRKNDEQKKR